MTIRGFLDCDFIALMIWQQQRKLYSQNNRYKTHDPYKQQKVRIIKQNNLKNRKSQIPMKNLQRQPTQLSSLTSPTALSTNSNSWQNEYFPMRASTNKFRQYFQQSIVTSINVNQMSEQYDKLVRMYQTENQQMQEKNMQLLGVVRQLKDKQADLLQEITALQNYYKKLIKSQQKKNQKQNTNNGNNNNVLRNLNLNGNQISDKLGSMPKGSLFIRESEESKHLKSLQQPKKQQLKKSQYMQCLYKNQKQGYMKQLNDQFCKLVQESLHEKEPGKRKQLRKQLAQLASQMKKIRSNEEETSRQLKIIDNEKDSNKTKRVSQNIQSVTSKTLAPYLENTTTTMSRAIKEDQTNIKQPGLVHSNSCRLERIKSSGVAPGKF